MIEMVADENLAVDLEASKQGKISRKVLIVEDHYIARLIAETLFVRQGCEVDLVENGKAAITQVQNSCYDFILMDIGLPGGMNGFEVTKEIRTFEQASGRPQSLIVGITCHAEDKKQEALDMGMDLILSKPLTEEMTLSILERGVANSKSVKSAA